MFKKNLGRNMEILLVEDGLMDARLTIGALRRGQLPHRLTLVRDGEEAMAFLNREGVFGCAPRPDLVLLDLLLPKKDGIEVLTEMKADYELQGIPVVVLTAADDEDAKTRCQMLGVEKYIAKPVNYDKFIGVVRELRNHWRHDELLLAALD